MENFEEMLENYLDENEINSKKKMDYEEPIKKKNYSKYKHQFEKTITIREFVNNYLGINHDCKNLRHIGLKSFESPYIISISNDFAIKNKEFVLRNEILIVVDSYGNPAAYVNPNLLKQITTMEELKNTINILEKIRLNNLLGIKSLYDQYDLINKKIIELSLSYSDGNELFRRLNKKEILIEIKKYAKQVSKNKDEIAIVQEKIEQAINLEYALIEQINEEIIIEEEGKENDKYKRR